MRNSFIDEQGRPVSVQFSKHEVVDISTGDHIVSSGFLGGTLYAGGSGDIVVELLDDDTAITLPVEAGHTLYRVKKVLQTGTTATGLKMFI